MYSYFLLLLILTLNQHKLKLWNHRNTSWKEPLGSSTKSDQPCRVKSLRTPGWVTHYNTPLPSYLRCCLQHALWIPPAWPCSSWSLLYSLPLCKSWLYCLCNSSSQSCQLPDPCKSHHCQTKQAQLPQSSPHRSHALGSIFKASPVCQHPSWTKEPKPEHNILDLTSNILPSCQ